MNAFINYINNNKNLVLLLQLVISTALLYLIIRRFKWDLFVEIAANTPIWFLFFSFLLSICIQFIYAIKWHLIMQEMGLAVPYKLVLLATFKGIFFANFAPAAIGQDASRIYFAGKFHGYIDMGVSVIIDRITALLAMILLALILALINSIWTNIFNSFSYVLLSVLSVILLGLAVARMKNGFVFNLLIKKFPNQSNIFTKMRHLANNATKICFRPKIMIYAILSILIVFILTAVIYYWFFSITSGLKPRFIEVTTALLYIVLITNLPLSINGIGVREQTHAFFFAALGVPLELAVASSLLFFFHMILASILGCIIWLTDRK